MKNFKKLSKFTIFVIAGTFLCQIMVEGARDEFAEAARKELDERAGNMIRRFLDELPEKLAAAFQNQAAQLNVRIDESAQEPIRQAVEQAFASGGGTAFKTGLQGAIQPMTQAVHGVSQQLEEFQNQSRGKAAMVTDMILDFLSDPKQAALGGTCIAAGIGSMVFAVKVLTPWVKSKIGKPKIIQNSSRSSWLSSSDKKESRLDEIIMKPELRKQLMEIVAEIKNAQVNGTGLFNVLLYGPPGTGKTMFAEALAIESGIDFEMTSGSRFVQLAAGKDVQALNELVDYAEKSDNGVLIFVDEAQSLLADRYSFGTEKRARDLTEAFLARIPKPPNEKFMFVFATNHPEQLDDAAWDRTKGHQIEIGLPEAPERAKIFNMYLKKFSLETGTPISKTLRYDTAKLASMMEGFSARSIEEIARGIVRKTIQRQHRDINFDTSRETITLQIQEDKKQQERLEKLKRIRREQVILQSAAV